MPHGPLYRERQLTHVSEANEEGCMARGDAPAATPSCPFTGMVLTVAVHFSYL